MAIEVNLKRGLDRKQWEMCNYAPSGTTIGSFIVSSNLPDQYQFYVTSSTTAFLYDPFEDGWMSLPSPAMGGTFGAGSCGARHPWGPSGFATAGTTTTLTTNLNIQRSLKGYSIRIIAGPNAGVTATIKSNTIGTNSVIILEETMGTAFTTASEYILVTGRVWFLNGGTQSGTTFKYYDVALNTWVATPVSTGLPATIATDGKLISTPGYLEDFASGTATSATSTTIVNSAKTWTTNNWANYQVRIKAGTGAGQIRSISSNTATTLTVSPSWTITPDSTSQYVIEGNSDYIYFMGNNAVALYRYSISANTWTLLSPGTARAGAPGAGMSANWVWDVSDPDWSNESNNLNGRYIYSFRGGGSSAIDRYDIAANAWSVVPYSPGVETFTTGTSYNYTENFIYIHQISPMGRFLKYNIAQSRLEPFGQLWYGQSTVHLGDRFFDVSVTEGATKLQWLYTLTHNQNTLFRVMIF